MSIQQHYFEALLAWEADVGRVRRSSPLVLRSLAFTIFGDFLGVWRGAVTRAEEDWVGCAYKRSKTEVMMMRVLCESCQAELWVGIGKEFVIHSFIQGLICEMWWAGAHIVNVHARNDSLVQIVIEKANPLNFRAKRSLPRATSFDHFRHQF